MAEKNPTATTPITILTESTSRSVTRQLQSLVTVKGIDLDRDQTDSWTGYRMDRHPGRCQTCHLSYHMINSDRKSQSYNSKYMILSHNVLMVVKTLRSK